MNSKTRENRKETVGNPDYQRQNPTGSNQFSTTTFSRTRQRP